MFVVKQYFREKGVATCAETEEARPVIGIPEEFEMLEDHSTASDAMAYLQSVRTQAKSLPFAVEAVTVSEEPSQAYDASMRRESRGSSPQCQTVDDVLPGNFTESVLDYFLSLRELLSKPAVERKSILIDFTGLVDEVLVSADQASVSAAVEDLSELLDEMEKASVVAWLFGLLVHLDTPLLEDTAAALQTLRRYCELDHGDPAVCRRKQICRIIIREFFSQC